MTSHTESARRILGDFEKVSSWSWVLPREKTVGLRLFTEAKPQALGRCRTRWGGGRWKSQYRKNVYLSPYVEEPLNSKVIKSSYLNWEVITRFSNFEIPMFYLYGHSMYVSHIAISWLWYSSSNATNNLTSKKQKVCSLCYRHAETTRRKGRKRCDLFYGGEVARVDEHKRD